MDPFSGRVFSSLVFALGLGSLIGCLGYLLVATRSLRREVAGTEQADEDAAPVGVSNVSTDGGSGSSDTGGFVFGDERDGGGRSGTSSGERDS